MTETTEQDGIPPWQDFMIPVLKVLSDGVARKRHELISSVLDEVGMSEGQRGILLNSGQSKVENRVGWAMSDLTTATAIQRPVRATFEITRCVAGEPQCSHGASRLGSGERTKTLEIRSQSVQRNS